jgi:hypothetical protein
MSTEMTTELYKVMDMLVALKLDLHCEAHVAPEAMIMPAHKARAACDAIEGSLRALKGLIAQNTH